MCTMAAIEGGWVRPFMPLATNIIKFDLSPRVTQKYYTLAIVSRAIHTIFGVPQQCNRSFRKRHCRAQLFYTFDRT